MWVQPRLKFWSRLFTVWSWPASSWVNGVGNVTVRPSGQRGEADLVAQVVGGEVQAEEAALGVAGVVQVRGIDGIQEAVRPGPVDGAVDADVLRSASQGEPALVGPEPGAAAGEVAVERRAEAGLRDQVNHRARLVTVLRGHVAVDHLDGLRDAGVDRVGERDPGLIGDGLPVHDVLALAVEALEMEAAVLVLGEARVAVISSSMAREAMVAGARAM